MLNCGRPLISAALLFLLSACGAKSGLGIDEYPDAGPPDLGSDLGTDLGPPDLGPTDAGEPCIPLPVTVDAGITTVEVALDARTSGADVAFLVDVTGSMSGVIEQLQREIRTVLVPALRDAIPDVRFSVSSFADFPIPDYGDLGDTPYTTRTEMTMDVAAVEAGIGTLVAGGGNDGPEAQVEALYQLATGEGRRGTMPYVPPASCPAGTFGAPCFREGVLPLVFVFTDNASHNGLGGGNAYDPTLLGTTPATYPEAIAALGAHGMPVVTFWSPTDPSITDAEQRQLARDTGAVDAAGAPLVFGVGHSGVDLVARVLEAVGTIGDGLATNVDLFVTDPTPGDGIDAVALVSAIIPLRAEPPTGIDGIDVASARFLGVRGAARVIFRLEVRTDLVVQRATPQEVLLDVHFRGDGTSDLGVQRLRFIVPAFDGTGCEPLGV